MRDRESGCQCVSRWSLGYFLASMSFYTHSNEHSNQPHKQQNWRINLNTYSYEPANQYISIHKQDVTLLELNTHTHRLTNQPMSSVLEARRERQSGGQEHNCNGKLQWSTLCEKKKMMELLPHTHMIFKLQWKAWAWKGVKTQLVEREATPKMSSNWVLYSPTHLCDKPTLGRSANLTSFT